MYKIIKRGMDIVFCGVLSLFLLPLFAVLCAFVKFTSKGGVFFTQKRVGKDNIHFGIYKFRTMYIDTPKDTPTHLLENPEKYITPVGKFLRKTSFDELPQLINILKGEMSLVGPRPALWNQYDLIALRDKGGASACVPGLTGLAQINGRDELPIETKAAYDNEYAKKLSFFLDLRIFFGTFFFVLTGRGIQEGVSSEVPKSSQNHPPTHSN
ncbi:UDP-phosphate galactose phosphotransferase [Clostridia bacterium]|nr:UDP-phosphate galactose phosphotransferase [Clostridia bacterium]